MKVPKRIRAFARRGRAVLFPMGEIKSHFGSMIRQTGRELGFKVKVVQQLEAVTELTLQEIGVQK